jgi:hypothetical protein
MSGAYDVSRPALLAMLAVTTMLAYRYFMPADFTA